MSSFKFPKDSYRPASQPLPTGSKTAAGRPTGAAGAKGSPLADATNIPAGTSKPAGATAVDGKDGPQPQAPRPTANPTTLPPEPAYKAKVAGRGAKAELKIQNWQEDKSGLTIIEVDYKRGDSVLRLEIALTQSAHLNKAAHEGDSSEAKARKQQLQRLLTGLVEFSLEQSKTQERGWRTELAVGPDGKLQQAKLVLPTGQDKKAVEVDLLDQKKAHPYTINLDDIAPGSTQMTNQQWLDQISRQLREVVKGQSVAHVAEVGKGDAAHVAAELDEQRRADERQRQRQHKGV